LFLKRDLGSLFSIIFCKNSINPHLTPTDLSY
jgi:hypothetical protein